MKKKLLVDEVYMHNVLLVISPWEEFKTYVVKNYDTINEIIGDDDSCQGLFLTIVVGEKIEATFLWLKEFRYTIECNKVLVHEMLHLVQRTMRSTQIPSVEETDDAWAYYFSYMYKKAIVAISEFKKKDDKKKMVQKKQSKKQKRKKA